MKSSRLALLVFSVGAQQSFAQAGDCFSLQINYQLNYPPTNSSGPFPNTYLQVLQNNLDYDLAPNGTDATAALFAGGANDTLTSYDGQYLYVASASDDYAVTRVPIDDYDSTNYTPLKCFQQMRSGSCLETFCGAGRDQLYGWYVKNQTVNEVPLPVIHVGANPPAGDAQLNICAFACPSQA